MSKKFLTLVYLATLFLFLSLSVDGQSELKKLSLTELDSIGFYHLNQFDYNKATPYFNELIERADKEANHKMYLQGLNKMGSLNKNFGYYEEAEIYYKKAIDYANSQDKMKLLTYYSPVINNLALLYQGLGRFDEAESLFRENLKLVKETEGTKSIAYLKNLNNMAVLYRRQ